ncbi:alpha/beta fold hydrolase [Oceanobacter mangrovi]|uniref:alpha/beta fold hydrolase n=1 Tax=Oceanobacter mangrovi TaxID=2862510 RepID=UPI001C8ED027|nr:alpha/beta hydrolase [Oceanobacter mangrovi]
MTEFLYGAQVNANGIRQHYLRYGGAGKQPLVLIPGITSPAVTWGFVAEKLAEKYDVYVLDVRGRGLSESGPELDYSPAACADDAIELIKALGLTNVILMGHSMGARFAALAVARGAQGISQLVLVDPPVSGPGRREYPSKLPWYVDSIRQSLVGMSAEDMKAFCPTWTEEQRALRAQWLHSCYEPAIVRAFNDFHEVDFHQDLAAVKLPCSLMVAGKGGVIQPEDEAEMLTLCPQLAIAHVGTAGHMIPWDDLDGFINTAFELISAGEAAQ